MSADRPSGPRLSFPDGLRGIAAIMVVGFHFHESLYPAVRSWIPDAVSQVLMNFNLGVEIFFVLSGFVIARSISDGERSWRYLGWFGLRRSIRLDPPLWATILVELALVRVSLTLFPSLATPIPGLAQIATNVTYTQHFFGLKDIVPVFWSLTFEVQFYAVLVGSLIVLSKIGASRQHRVALFAVAFAYSLLVWLEFLPPPMRGLFIERWFQFALGVSVWLTLYDRLHASRLIVLCAFAGLLMAMGSATEYRLLSTGTAVVTALVMYVAGLRDRMSTALGGRALQFLGRVSYSLYLIHLTVGWRFISVVKLKWGPELSPLEGAVAFFGGITLSVGAAWVMHAILEAPAMRLAQRVPLPRRRIPGAGLEECQAG